MFVRPDNWSKMTPLERRAARLDHWQNQPVQFESAEAEAGYKERIGRMRKAYDLERPDRVIADGALGLASFAVRRKGLTGTDILYNHEALREPLIEYHKEFEPDVAVAGLPYPGKTFDILGLNTYQWGGHGIPDSMVVQAVEDEYMTADEYHDFLTDPTNFWLKKYLPRAASSLEPLAMLMDFPRFTEWVDIMDLVIPFGTPPVKEMLQKLMDAGDEVLKMLGTVGQTGGMLAGMGYPSLGLQIAKVPFDYLGDLLRGTKGIMTDMYRHPDVLKEACDRYVPILIKSLTAACDQLGAPTAFYVLHKGADGFMSQEQFETFYWPQWKATMMGLYEEGIISYLYIEGRYNTRLEYLAEMPDKSLICHFDQTDMVRVKEMLSEKFTIAGNVPASLMSTGSPEAVRAYCDNLVDLYKDAPGYVLSFGCDFEMTTDENVRAFHASVRG